MKKSGDPVLSLANQAPGLALDRGTVGELRELSRGHRIDEHLARIEVANFVYRAVFENRGF